MESEQSSESNGKNWILNSKSDTQQYSPGINPKDSEPNSETTLDPSPISSKLLWWTFWKESKYELFIIYIINILVSLNYYILITLIPIYFTQENASDSEVGIIFGTVGILIGIFAIILGPFINSIGCKRALVASTALSFIGFNLLLWTRNIAINLVGIGLFLTIGLSMSWPVVELGSKIYTKPIVWNLSNSVIMIGNFFSGIIAGTSIDYIWSNYNEDSAYKLIYGTAVLSSFIALIASILIRKSSKSTEYSELEEIQITKNMLKTRKFWRFVVLIFLLIFMRSGCFGHLDATFPKYLLRKVGQKVHFGAYLALHSATMLIGTIIFTPVSYICSSYLLIAFGGLLGSFAPFFLVIGSDTWNCVFFVIIISLGESLWSPRLLDYTLKIASPGEEGTYLALCNCPFYFCMILTGSLSGTLLETFCPENNTSQCNDIWFVIGAFGIFIPIILLIFRFSLEQPETEPNQCILENDNINILNTQKVEESKTISPEQIENNK